MLGNTPVLFLGFVCCFLALYFSSWSCLLISVGWVITHSLHSMDLALSLWQTILDENSRPLVHLPRDNTRLAGDPTEKDSRIPPRLGYGICSWADRMFYSSETEREFGAAALPDKGSFRWWGRTDKTPVWRPSMMMTESQKTRRRKQVFQIHEVNGRKNK